MFVKIHSWLGKWLVSRVTFKVFVFGLAPYTRHKRYLYIPYDTSLSVRYVSRRSCFLFQLLLLKYASNSDSECAFFNINFVFLHLLRKIGKSNRRQILKSGEWLAAFIISINYSHVQKMLDMIPRYSLRHQV